MTTTTVLLIVGFWIYGGVCVLPPGQSGQAIGGCSPGRGTSDEMGSGSETHTEHHQAAEEIAALLDRKRADYALLGLIELRAGR